MSPAITSKHLHFVDETDLPSFLVFSARTFPPCDSSCYLPFFQLEWSCPSTDAIVPQGFGDLPGGEQQSLRVHSIVCVPIIPHTNLWIYVRSLVDTERIVCVY